MNKQHFSSNQIKKYSIIIVIILLFTTLSFALFKIAEKIKHKNDFIPEITLVDDPSGLEVYNTNYDPEITTQDLNPLIIGFGILQDCGFTEQNRVKVISIVRDYFKEKYPEVNKVSYKKGTFLYPEADNKQLTQMTIVSDSNEEFSVAMKEISLNGGIEVTITPLPPHSSKSPDDF